MNLRILFAKDKFLFDTPVCVRSAWFCGKVYMQPPSVFLVVLSFLNIIMIINCGSVLMHFVDAVVYVVVAILLYSFLQRIPKRMAKQWSECSSLDS